MSTKPTETLDWASANAGARVKPPTALEQNGFGFGGEASSQNFNWIFWNIYAWINYLSSQTVRTFSSVEGLIDALTPGQFGYVASDEYDTAADQNVWREAWNANTTDGITRICTDGERVYVVENDRYVRAYNVETGVLEWSYTDLALTLVNDLCCDGKFVYFGYDDHIYSLTAETGVMFSNAPLTGGVKAALVACDGSYVYVYGDEGGGGANDVLFVYAQPISGGVGAGFGAPITSVNLAKDTVPTCLEAQCGFLFVGRLYDSLGSGAEPAYRAYDVRDIEGVGFVELQSGNVGTNGILACGGDGHRWWIATRGDVARLPFFSGLRSSTEQILIPALSSDPTAGSVDLADIWVGDGWVLLVREPTAGGDPNAVKLFQAPVGTDIGSPVWGFVHDPATGRAIRCVCSDTRRIFMAGDEVGAGKTIVALNLPQRTKPRLYKRTRDTDRDRLFFNGLAHPA